MRGGCSSGFEQGGLKSPVENSLIRTMACDIFAPDQIQAEPLAKVLQRHSRESRDFNRVIYLTLEHLFEPEVEFKII